MRFKELRVDARMHCQRLAKAAKGENPINVATEFSDQLYPFLEAMCDALIAEVAKPLADLEDAIAEQGETIEAIIDGEGDVIHEELATKIIGVLEIGKVACNELERLAVSIEDDLARRRLSEIIFNYRRGAEIVSAEVMENTVGLEGSKEQEASKDEAEEGAETEGDTEEGSDAEGSNEV